MSQLNAKTNAQVQKKPRAPPICWSDPEIRTIVTWFCRRDASVVPVNYEAYSNGNQQTTGEQMLIETGLKDKPGVNKKKASDKINDMIKTYKEWRLKAERSGWGTGENEHEEFALTGGFQNVKTLLLSKCSWFYDFESFFHKHPTVNPPLIVESGGPSRRDGKAIDDRELGGIMDETTFEDIDLDDVDGVGLKENDNLDDNDTNSDSDHSVFSQIHREVQRKTTRRHQERTHHGKI